jgi:glycerol kinase
MSSEEQLILALDQGTSSSRAVLFTAGGTAIAQGQRPLTSQYPKPGWVEQDPEEIWFTQWASVQDCLKRAPAGSADRIAAIGIANQRETVVVWDRRTGAPVYNAIVWQCRRTAAACQSLKDSGLEELVSAKTGLTIDPYFSATKIAWILDHVPGARERAKRGELAFGTVDAWLVYRLSRRRRHVTDVSNASRTLLFNVTTLAWDDELMAVFDVPTGVCPDIVDSSGTVCETDPSLFGRAIPIAGIAGDQQAALFGQGCWDPGMVKNTYGTGSFLLMNTGPTLVRSAHGLISTIAWRLSGQAVQYALEGSVFATGAVVQWLRDELKIIGTAAESEALAASVPDSAGVYLVPAFAGLGAPYWDSAARGTIVGISRGTTRAHIVRAALESIAFQTGDVLEAMARDSRRQPTLLRADGGAIANRFLAQFQADILGIPLHRAAFREATAQGAGLLAARGVNLLDGAADDQAALGGPAEVFVPQMEEDERNHRFERWRLAVTAARAFAVDPE